MSIEQEWGELGEKAKRSRKRPLLDLADACLRYVVKGFMTVEREREIS